MPAQQRSGRHQPEPAQPGREQPGECGEHGAVSPVQLRPTSLAAQHRYLVPQHQDLDVLGRIFAAEQRKPTEHANPR